jgi:hypothetical protein
MFLLGVPLLIFPFTIYNIVAFLLPGISWTDVLLPLRMKSGAEWAITYGDAIVAASILILLIEMMKAARMSRRTIIDHLLSILLFAGMLTEFLTVKEAGTTTFFLLLVISFVDVAGGFVVSIRAAQRDVSVREVENVHTH